MKSRSLFSFACHVDIKTVAESRSLGRPAHLAENIWRPKADPSPVRISPLVTLLNVASLKRAERLSTHNNANLFFALHLIRKLATRTAERADTALSLQTHAVRISGNTAAGASICFRRCCPHAQTSYASGRGSINSLGTLRPPAIPCYSYYILDF